MNNLSSRTRINAEIGRFCQKLKPVNSLLCEIAFFMWVCVGVVFPIFEMSLNQNELSLLWVSRPELVLSLYVALIVEISIIARIILFGRKVEKQTKVIKEHAVHLEKIIEIKTKELKEAISKLEIVASTDHLTKIANVRLLKDTLHEEFIRSLRTKREFTVIMFDVDHFKKINDTYGHLMGDKILVQIAQDVKQVVRDVDLLGRYGGEEFLVILPESDLTIAASVAERIRAIVEKINIDGVTCTVSLGVASSSGLLSVSEILGLTDDALYFAKDAGRNNVQVITNKCVLECNSCDEELRTQCRYKSRK